eukprot:scaffold275_cov167-Ochromonas_danica.AAC.4
MDANQAAEGTMARRHGLPIEGLQEWLLFHRHGPHHFKKQRCLRPIFDEISLMNVKNSILNGKTNEELILVFGEEAERTDLRRKH